MITNAWCNLRVCLKVCILSILVQVLSQNKTVAQDSAPTLSLSDVVALGEFVAVIGTTDGDLVDAGYAYYEIYDDLGIIDYGITAISNDGSFLAYMTNDMLRNTFGNAEIALYRPSGDDFQAPYQVNFMMGVDSVTETFTRVMLNGNAAEVRAFINLMAETGQLTAAQFASLQARLLLVEAAEAAAAHLAGIIAREIAAAKLCETAVVTAAKIRGYVTDIIRGLCVRAYVPALTASSRAIMLEALAVIRTSIASQTARLAWPGLTAANIEGIRRAIAVQESRLRMVTNWLTQNNIPIPP